MYTITTVCQIGIISQKRYQVGTHPPIGILLWRGQIWNHRILVFFTLGFSSGGGGGGGYEICGLTPTVPLVMPLGGVFVVMFKWKGTCCKKRSCYLGTDFCNTVSTRIDRDW